MKFLLILLSAFLVLSYEEKNIKNILAFVFPGGKSHNFVFKSAFTYASEKIHNDNPNIEYKFHILVHNSDKYLWDNSKFEIYGYGDVTQYEEKFRQAMDNARADPVLGYNNFSNAMIHLYNDFLKDKILLRLKKIKFDLLIPDVVNFLTVFLKKELDVKMEMYLNPTCILTWINQVMEYNAAYHPILGTKFTEQMNFYERFTNSVFLIGTRIIYKYFDFMQKAVFKDYGYNYDLDPFPKNAFYLNQCVNGVHYANTLPSNVVSIGAILPQPSNQITDQTIINFLNQYNKNIYISQGTITKIIRLEVFNELFTNFPNIGFILSLKDEFEKEFILPPNVLRRQWVPQNDLLGNAKLTGFITHGGLNSILESLYHSKPMITIGTNIDQINSAIIIKYRKYGIGITNESEITIENLINSLKELIENDEYKINCELASRYIKAHNGKENFYYWLNYIMEHGYDHLLIPAYSKYNFIELYNIDIHIFWLLILYFIFYILKKIFWVLICKRNKIK